MLSAGSPKTEQIRTTNDNDGRTDNSLPLGETFLLEDGVVGITGTDTGEVVACS